MATKFFLTSAAGTGCGTGKSLALKAGSGLVTGSGNTSNGPIGACFPVEFVPALDFLSKPLEAVTISGTITINLWMSESNMAANAGARITISKYSGGVATQIVACDVSNTCIGGSSSAGSGADKGIELPVTTRAAQNWTATPASVSLAAGDILIVQPATADAGGTMNTGWTFDLGYNGGTAGADGDSWVQFTETITERASVAPQVLSPRNSYH